MNVTILHTEDCPNLELLLAEVRSLIDSRGDVTLTTTPVISDADAMRLGFHGSPTILIDGIDPFRGPAEPVGLSCRSYPCCADAAGRAPGYPSREKLAEVLQFTS
jgi:hypothetical protein